MAEKKLTNVRMKLAQARLMFLEQNVKKSGKNMHLEFKYFELADIVPAATRIFAEVGLVSTTEFNADNAVMTIFNCDNPEEPGIVFSAPYREMEPIVSNKGNVVTNAMQALGSSITYLRRYLYMMALDIVEADDVEATLGAGTTEDEAPAPKKSAPPATPAQREEAKQTMTDTEGNADELQITALKNACKELLAKDPTMEEFVQQIAMKTNGFTTVTRSACEQLVTNLGEMIAAYGDQ